jgi:hypothetical protein
MTIDDAIENLKDAKKRGVKSVILAWWDALDFSRQDDEAWEHAAEMVERKHDWSSTHEDLKMTLDLYTSE